MSTPLYAAFNSISERRKLSSAGLEWFQYEIKSLTETFLSIAAFRNALSISGQYLWVQKSVHLGHWISIKN